MKTYFEGEEKQMKALIVWDSYGTEVEICEVEKKSEDYYSIEKELLSCRRNEVDIKSVLGKEHNYLSDSVGSTHLMESYVCLISELQAEKIINTFKSKKEQEIEKQKKVLNSIEEHKMNMLNKAIETGVEQELSRRMEPCNDINEECSWDGVISFINPDGSIKEERNHFY